MTFPIVNCQRQTVRFMCSLRVGNKERFSALDFNCSGQLGVFLGLGIENV